MQNEPKFQKPQMNVSNVLTSNYENWTLGNRGKNKPKTNPIQSQFKPNPQNAKINLIHYPKRTYNVFRYFALFKNEPKRTQNEPKPQIALIKDKVKDFVFSGDFDILFKNKLCGIANQGNTFVYGQRPEK